MRRGESPRSAGSLAGSAHKTLLCDRQPAGRLINRKQVSKVKGRAEDDFPYPYGPLVVNDEDINEQVSDP
jgi:hypothetical protein